MSVYPRPLSLRAATIWLTYAAALLVSGSSAQNFSSTNISSQAANLSAIIPFKVPNTVSGDDFDIQGTINDQYFLKPVPFYPTPAASQTIQAFEDVLKSSYKSTQSPIELGSTISTLDWVDKISVSWAGGEPAGSPKWTPEATLQVTSAIVRWISMDPRKRGRYEIDFLINSRKAPGTMSIKIRRDFNGNEFLLRPKLASNIKYMSGHTFKNDPLDFDSCLNLVDRFIRALKSLPAAQQLQKGIINGVSYGNVILRMKILPASSSPSSPDLTAGELADLMSGVPGLLIQQGACASTELSIKYPLSNGDGSIGSVEMTNTRIIGSNPLVDSNSTSLFHTPDTVS